MALLQLRGKPLIFMILITSGLDFLLFGYDQGMHRSLSMLKSLNVQASSVASFPVNASKIHSATPMQP
jgi:hypothetical protein